MNEVVKFLKENPVQYFATVGKDNKAKVRPFQFMLEDGGKLWFCTNNQKDVYEEMQGNPYVQVCVSTPKFEWIRLSGKAVFKNDMDIKDKLRLAICMSQSKWSGLIYNTKENYEKFDAMLKEVDEEYRTTLINFAKYKLVMFAMAKLMEMESIEQNQVALYLYNYVSKK